MKLVAVIETDRCHVDGEMFEEDCRVEIYGPGGMTFVDVQDLLESMHDFVNESHMTGAD